MTYKIIEQKPCITIDFDKFIYNISDIDKFINEINSKLQELTERIIKLEEKLK